MLKSTHTGVDSRGRVWFLCLPRHREGHRQSPQEPGVRTSIPQWLLFWRSSIFTAVCACVHHLSGVTVTGSLLWLVIRLGTAGSYFKVLHRAGIAVQSFDIYDNPLVLLGWGTWFCVVHTIFCVHFVLCLSECENACIRCFENAIQTMMI